MESLDQDKKEETERIIRTIQKKLIRAKDRKRERLLRKYGTDVPAIKVIILTPEGLVVGIMVGQEFREIRIPLDKKILDYEKYYNKGKLKHLFHEDKLLVDIYTLGDGVLYTVELMEYLFDELL